jgi:putative flippase GtrA
VSAEDLAVPFRARLGDGLRRPANWLELVRFGLVGAGGYVVNLTVFALLVHAVGTGHRTAALGAFLVAVANNFLWNRRWTFRAREGGRVPQAARFLTVSVAAFLLGLAVLEALVAGAGLPEVPSQALAIACATPASFLGNKLWTFSR